MDKLIAEAEELFSEIGEIVSEHQKTQRERDKNGENFNVFKALGVQRNKECLHSAFIAELLNPKGAHGMKDSFLKLFKKLIIDVFYPGGWDFDTVNATVRTEFPFDIGKYNGRIDILIECESSKHTKGIIIENKIDACDQEDQLFRYDRFGESRYDCIDNYQLIYLTPEGEDATWKSTRNDKDLEYRYISISYKENIMHWLGQCINKCPLPIVQEVLVQYENNLKDIFGLMMDKQTTDRLLAKAVSKKNIDATLAIIKHQDAIQKEIIADFIKQMEKVANKYGLECATRGDLPNLKPNSGLFFFYPGKHWCLFIGAYKHIKSQSIIYGITQRDDGEKIQITKNRIKDTFKPAWEGRKYPNTQCPDFPLGFANLYWDNEETRKNQWWNWNKWEAIEAMANGKLAKWLDKHTFNEVLGDNRLHKNLLRYIERITKEY